MGFGGLIAVTGGVMFLVLVLRSVLRGRLEEQNALTRRNTKGKTKEHEGRSRM
jgi:hypothetical protein